MEKGKKKVGAKKTTKVVTPVAKKNNNQLKATVMGIAMIVAALGLGVGTFAYYQSTITGTASGSITAWSFLVNNQATSFTASLGDLKPGVSGQIELGLSAADSGLDIDASITFSGKTNWPANLKLYTDSGKTSEIVFGETEITRQLTAGTGDTVIIYYDWPIGTSAETSPSTSQNASFLITVVGTQVEK